VNGGRDDVLISMSLEEAANARPLLCSASDANSLRLPAFRSDAVILASLDLAVRARARFTLP
jgi:hypothetical protein